VHAVGGGDEVAGTAGVFMYDGTHGAGGASGSNGAHASGASTAGDVARPIPLVADGRPPDGRPARRRLGVAIVGLGGAVATTAVAGIALLRAGAADTTGLPLAGLPADLTAELARYEDLVFGGWDLDPSDLARAAAAHRVLDRDQLEAARGRSPPSRRGPPWGARAGAATSTATPSATASTRPTPAPRWTPSAPTCASSAGATPSTAW
jgi:hypothetical protein